MIDFIIGVPGLILSLVMLIFSGDALVRGSVSLASRFGISSLVIGLTVVAFGTSAPELLVSVGAALNNHPEIALGNVIGSNIANVGLVLGVTALFITLPIKSKRLFKDWMLMVFSFGLLSLFLWDNTIERWEGILFVVLLVTYVIVSVVSSRQDSVVTDNEPGFSKSLWVSVGLIALACVGLSVGAYLLVESASEIASNLGVSERVISITVVAFGTSVPELTASIVAALKKETEISIGNIIGSNLFNVLAVIGVVGTIKPIQVNFGDFSQDLIWMMVFAFILMILVYPFRNNTKHIAVGLGTGGWFDLRSGRLTFLGGGLLVLLYVSYVLYLFFD